MQQIQLINIENVSEEEASKYKVRKATRAIVFDKDRLIALIHATKTFCYNLPGGGLEEGEDYEDAVKRECKEEIGCDIEIEKEFGTIVEYRKEWEMKQISYCYIAKVVGEKSETNLDQYEIDEGYETIWLPLNEAIEKIKESKPNIYEGQYVVSRSLAFLEAAKKN